MRRVLQIALFLGTITLFFSSCKKNYEGITFMKNNFTKLDTITFTHSMKGWELYSWQENSDWKYSFMIGTNAQKALVQVTTNPISVIGEDSLKVILKKLPQGEEIIWLGQLWLEKNWRSNYENLMLPPRKIQIDIKEFCDSRNLKLIIEE